MNGNQTQIHVRPGCLSGGSVRVPGDKSISHRVLILGALAEGTSQARNFLPAGDTLAALHCIEALGVTVEQHAPTVLTVHGRGLRGLARPDAPLDCANAGTALRLLAGVLSGQPFPSVLDGSAQLRQRPMRRITDPLRRMGANIVDRNGHAPLEISPAVLRGITYDMPVASAQVKSCLMLAGLLAETPTTINEPGPARDHTERMLRAMGAELAIDGAQVRIGPGQGLRPLDITIPGDISSAAFLLLAAVLHSEETVRIVGVGVNPTRTGILDILSLMGINVELVNHRDENGEPVADMIVRQSPLIGAHIGGDLVVRAIDEFPALMVAATQANGETIVMDAAELRVKETDRIAVMAHELRKMGAEIEERADGFRVTGPQWLRGTTVDGHDDHRVAMALVIAGLGAEGETCVENARCVVDSFPNFVETLQVLGADMEQ